MKLVLPEGCTDIVPGQFINISIDGKYLRRPISICDWDDNTITIVYKVVGAGTDWLSSLSSNDVINALLPLGNGFNIENLELLVGGGIGVPPLLGVAKTLNKIGVRPKIVLGFLTKEEVILEDEFKQYGDVYISTDDGSYGDKGLVTDTIIKNGLANQRFATCGPLPMEKALVNTMNVEGLVSLEARMGCGFGACMGCSIKTKNGNKRICKDGPVFNSEELLW